MLHIIKNFFKEFFKDDIGKYDPEADKVHFKQVLYWVIGLIVGFLIPTCLVYLEVGQFDWNVFKFMWGEEAKVLYKEGFYRGAYFIGGLLSNVLFLLCGFFSTYVINGKRIMLEYKKASRFLFFLSSPITVTLYIIANIIY